MAKLTAKSVEKGLREFGGNIAAVGRLHGVTRQAVQGYIRRRPALQEVLVECCETMKDNVVSALHNAAIKGESWAVCFYLKTQAKDRGYTEQAVQQGQGIDPAIVMKLLEKIERLEKEMDEGKGKAKK